MTDEAKDALRWAARARVIQRMETGGLHARGFWKLTDRQQANWAEMLEAVEAKAEEGFDNGR